MGAIATNRRMIDVVEAGGGEQTPILFLHGVGSDHTVWKPQIDHFGRQRRAVALAYPGYGNSDFVAGATRDDYAAAMLATMDALAIKIGRAHV